MSTKCRTLAKTHTTTALCVVVSLVLVGAELNRPSKNAKPIVQTPSVTAPRPIYSDQPNAIVFAPVPTRFIRLVILGTSTNEPCIDELEVFGSAGSKNLASAETGAVASASSCLIGYAKHTIEHLNDGHYGNEFSWIASDKTEQWAQIELPHVADISKVVFSRDRTGRYSDRTPTDLEVQVSLDGRKWKQVVRVVGRAVGSHKVAFSAHIPPAPAPPRPDGNEQANRLDAATAVPGVDEAGFENLAIRAQAKPSASSVLPGFSIHRIAHLNDGLAGNDHSWIAKSNPAWAEIDLGDTYWVYHVALSNDRANRYRDRAPTSFSILSATRYQSNSDADVWKTVYKQREQTPVCRRTSFRFQPVQARWIRIAIQQTNGGSARIDEIEVFGQKGPIAEDQLPVLRTPGTERVVDAWSKSEYEQRLRFAWLAEEHAWLKTFGHADLSSRLVPYNGRVKEYPRHAPADRLPLTTLDSKPVLDGHLDDSCWQRASRGVARVTSLDQYSEGPLVETSVAAGYRGDDLYLGIRTSRLLSSHIAVISASDGSGLGVVVLTQDGLRWNTFEPNGKPRQSQQLDGTCDASQTCFEVRVPLSMLPNCRAKGIRIGLGMRGKHTKPEGRAVHFAFAPFSIAQVGPCIGGVFKVQLCVPSDGRQVRLSGNVPRLQQPLTLAPGKSTTIRVQGEGSIGPEYALRIEDERGARYQLQLLRYDPMQRTLTLTEAMIQRLAAKGIDVAMERGQLAKLRERRRKFLAVAPDTTAERSVLAEARLAKRRLIFRDPELKPIADLLFVKRHAFEPSHNYSVILDSPYRPGGGVFRLSIPSAQGRLQPGAGRLTRLFDAQGGIARNPMADFDLSKVYFGYRHSKEDYFHIMAIGPDGTECTQLTDGPFHDYWPCPLPDGGLAFISTRCRARFLCWRPQAAVLFRMDADGQNIRPLSFANLTEWGPSVMRDGRIVWQRSEYVDKGADFSHTLWAIRPDGTQPELIFGNDIIQPNGYANGREVPGGTEYLCTLISHFGDLNGPLALIDPALGKFNPKAIRSITREVPWPGMWPKQECFRDGLPVSHDYFLCSHAPEEQFGLYVIDRFGNREMIYLDPAIGSMCPTLFKKQSRPPVLPEMVDLDSDHGEFLVEDVYKGIEPPVQRGQVRYLRVCQEVRANLQQLANGSYRNDHPSFQDWYATPTHKVCGPYGWPSYVAKASFGIVPVEEDGSALFNAPAGKVLYFEVLDKDFNELQRMRSVVQLQPGERRGCVGCHEPRNSVAAHHPPMALLRPPSELEPPPWGAVPFAYEKVVQPVWDRQCVRCHNSKDRKHIDLTGTLDADKVPASYRTLISQGWVHYLDYGYNSGGNEKREPLTFGTVRSKLWKVLDKGHYDAELSREDQRRVKCWTDLNCPLWPDYKFRGDRPGNAIARKSK